jgi:hypothetical protein
MWIIRWAELGSEELHEELQDSLIALDAILDRLHDRLHGRMTSGAEIESGITGHFLALGFSKCDAVLSFVPKTKMPPYYVSHSDTDGRRTARFEILGYESEFLRCNLIPLEAARQAMKWFATTGERLDAIAWEEV